MAEKKCGFDGGDTDLELPNPPQTVREHMEQIAREPAILPRPRSVAQIDGELHTARVERMELLKEVGRWAAVQTPPITIVDGVVQVDMPPVPPTLTDAVGVLNEQIARLEYELWDATYRDEARR